MLLMQDVASLFPTGDPQGPLADGPFVVAAIIKILVFFVAYLVTVALMTLAERKISAWIQDRRGPNRTGPFGLLQPVADGIKNFIKESTKPGEAEGLLFRIAPALAFMPAMVTWAVIPFAAPLPTPWGLVDMSIANLPVGFLFMLAISSIGVYGLVLAGWASNNKYALLGGLRSSAQMVSYEIAMGMSTIPVLLLAGNVSLSAIIQQQQAQGWNVLLLTISWILFVIAGFAETNRLPFDLPEAESELVAGYHTEYSGMAYAMFPLAEYANMITVSALATTLFLGGWDVPFTSWDNTGPWTVLKTLVTFAAFAAKLGVALFSFVWIRWTLPRFRYDQLMALGWKVMLPLALAYIVIIAAFTLALEAAGLRNSIAFSAALFALNVVLLFICSRVLDRGRLISPASPRARLAEVERLRERSAVARRYGGNPSRQREVDTTPAGVA
ncbi:MAG: NADH-quinone oxidoreductase subunit NuoH [Gemmatimonadaceae bacterium]|jgi:NADH-quinone oxidoreductase subunit H|nr:NADH-quinone oxidoreductase subunit NuoH [Gemmatimonadaceae bacterium]